MAGSKTLAKQVAALLVVLGIRNVVLPATATLITAGLKGPRHVNVSSTDTFSYTQSDACFRACICGVLAMSTYAHQQSQRWPSVPCASDVASLRNLANLVAVVRMVPGLETAEALARPSLGTRGTRASRPAKDCRSPR